MHIVNWGNKCRTKEEVGGGFNKALTSKMAMEAIPKKRLWSVILRTSISGRIQSLDYETEGWGSNWSYGREWTGKCPFKHSLSFWVEWGWSGLLDGTWIREFRSSQTFPRLYETILNIALSNFNLALKWAVGYDMWYVIYHTIHIVLVPTDTFSHHIISAVYCSILSVYRMYHTTYSVANDRLAVGHNFFVFFLSKMFTGAVPFFSCFLCDRII